MDIFAHGLWTAVAYKAVNQKKHISLRVWTASFWGIFPDLFAFTIPFVWIVWSIISGRFMFSDFPRSGDVEPVSQSILPVFKLASSLYNMSHSAVVFFVAYGITAFILRRHVWEMGGWLLHILIDVPTHTYHLYPTPVLWPFSSWKFNGISWGVWWFQLINYSALIAAFLLLRRKNVNKHRSKAL